MKVCRRCLYTTLHPLGLIIDEEGICSGCRVHEEKDTLDWASRWSMLERLVDNYRCKSGSNYDCVVPVSGARDSFFIVHTVKKRLGLNPLLVTYNKHYNTAVGVRNLARLRTELDCDIMTLVIDPDRIKLITRATFRRWANIYWHCLAGQTVFPVQIAVKFKIPLIIWGHHQGLDQVGMYSHLDEVEMTRRYRRNHDLFRQEAESLISEHDFITADDVFPFRYPPDEELAAVGVRGIYLGNYIRWDTKAQHESMINLYNYEAVPQTRTFDTYNNVDCWLYSDVHDYIKYVKHGYGLATDHAVRELRFGRLRRDDAIRIAAEYEMQDPRHLDMFLEWIGMTKNGFLFVLDQHRHKHIWRWNCEVGSWCNTADWKNALNTSGVHSDHSPPFVSGCVFQVRQSQSLCDNSQKFILVGKGDYLSPTAQEPVVVYGQGRCEPARPKYPQA